MICKDKGLSALDRTLAEVYAAASHNSTDDNLPMLKDEQRSWIKERNECWKSDDKRRCVLNKHIYRIAELQARYALVPGTGPISYFCDDDPAKEVVATYFQTDPATLLAEYGESVSVMYIQPSGSGAKYQDRNKTLWEHQGEALITWGFEAPEMRCRKVK